jgi:RNA 2',3'-cyclic 3'-phosphodiesterase
MTTRFVAIGVPPSIRDVLYSSLAPVRAARPEVAWTDPRGWHVTLAFLGPLPNSSRREVVTAVERAVARAASADDLPGVVALGPADAFDDRVLITRIEDDPGGLASGHVAPLGHVASLGARVQAALVEAGLPVTQGPVRPHVTLARARRNRPIDDALVGLVRERMVPDRWVVDAVGVWSSHPRSGAPARYVVDDEVALAPPPA